MRVVPERLGHPPTAGRTKQAEICFFGSNAAVAARASKVLATVIADLSEDPGLQEFPLTTKTNSRGTSIRDELAPLGFQRS
jgi:hypothetical protein